MFSDKVRDVSRLCVCCSSQSGKPSHVLLAEFTSSRTDERPVLLSAIGDRERELAFSTVAAIAVERYQRHLSTMRIFHPRS